jgi:hypothetical protein
MSLPADQLAALQALLDAGTPLPWAVANDSMIVRGLEVTGRGSYRCISPVAEVCDESDREDWNEHEDYVFVEPEADGELIVAAVNALPALLAELEQLRTLAATCTCYDGNPANYEGPHADCAVHGAVQAYARTAREIEELLKQATEIEVELHEARAEVARLTTEVDDHAENLDVQAALAHARGDHETTEEQHRNTCAICDAYLATGERDEARAELAKAQEALRAAQLTIEARDAAIKASDETHRIARLIVAGAFEQRPLLEEFPELADARVTFDPRRNTAAHSYNGLRASDGTKEHPAHDGQTCEEYERPAAAGADVPDHDATTEALACGCPSVGVFAKDCPQHGNHPDAVASVVVGGDTATDNEEADRG